MQRASGIAAVIGVWAAVANSGCATHYQTPIASEPHAMVVFRRTYERTPGESLNEWLLVDGQDVFNRISSAAAIDAPIVDTLRVRPIPSRFTARMLFTHSEIRPLTARFNGRVPEFRTESLGCATGNCAREVTVDKTGEHGPHVAQYPPISDATCAKNVEFEPIVDHRYVLQLTYRQNGTCALSCTDQGLIAEGEAQSSPCGSDVTPANAPPEGASSTIAR